MIGRGIAWIGVTVAAVVIAVLHVAGAGRVDPVAQTVSDYVAVPDGAALLGLAAAGLIAAGFAGAVTLPTTSRRLLLRGAPPCCWSPCSRRTCRATRRRVRVRAPLGGRAGVRAASGDRRGGGTDGGRPPAPAAGRVDRGRGDGRAFLLAHAPHVLAGADVFPYLGLVERVAYLALLVQLVVVATPAARDVVVPAPPVRAVAKEAA